VQNSEQNFSIPRKSINKLSDPYIRKLLCIMNAMIKSNQPWKI